jgi:hypothetical protein
MEIGMESDKAVRERRRIRHVGANIRLSDTFDSSIPSALPLGLSLRVAKASGPRNFATAE